jgi:SAM-dependent methyltransferase
MFFLRKSTLERLPIAMSGVRMGERALQIGIDDPALAGAIAAKVGLSGHAAIAVPDARSAATAQRAAAAAGVLVDVQVAPLDSLRFEADAFDLIVLPAGASIPSFEGASAAGMLRECHRVLRIGGRIVIIEGSPRRGVAALFKMSTLNPDANRAATALGAAGFRVARVLAEREGYRFTEGLK